MITDKQSNRRPKQYIECFIVTRKVFIARIEEDPNRLQTRNNVKSVPRRYTKQKMIKSKTCNALNVNAGATSIRSVRQIRMTCQVSYVSQECYSELMHHRGLFRK